jgi:hypothetical protein
MPGQLSRPAPPRPAPARQGRAWRSVSGGVVAGLLMFALAGAVCGVVWEMAWTAPAGVAYQGRWALDGNGLPHDFSGTGLYALIAAIAGLLAGVVVASLFDRDEIISLVTIVSGSILAAYLMWLVGTSLGPPDPRVVAKSAADLQPVVSDLRVHGRGAFAAFPLGAMLAVAAVFILSGNRRGR